MPHAKASQSSGRTVLVSGANGFIAAHAVEQLLERGDAVVGTVRDPRDSSKNQALLAMSGAAERLKLVAADLSAVDPFSAHMDVDAVLHMASPYSLNVKDPQRDLVDPAVNGTLSLLRAAAASPRVRRIVLTSSMAAITDEPDGRVLTEADWNTSSSLTRNPYYFSKAEAERAAWRFMEKEKPHFELVVINPFLVVGPAHSQAINTSNEMFVDILGGKYPAIMALEWGFVDVRDVADTHLRALDRPQAKGRYICAAGNMNMADLVALIRRLGYPGKLPSLRLDGAAGTALMKLASHAQPAGVGSYLRTHLGRVPRFDNAKAKQELGSTFRPVADSIADTLADLAYRGHIKPSLAGGGTRKQAAE
jgi:dihydroflavonol-4-reductase